MKSKINLIKKFNKKNITITKKLFIINAIVFAIFIGSTLIIQSLFFEKLYIYKKKTDLIDIINKLKVEYNKADEDTQKELIEECEIKNNIEIIVLQNSNTVKILKFLPSFSNNRANMGRARELTDFIKIWLEDDKNLINLNKKNKNIIVYSNPRDKSSPQNIINISSNDEKDEIFFALTSLQPVNEAVSVIERLYLYFCIGAVFFIILLSFIYSNMIAKPLVKINKVATKLANLDFSEKCEVKSNDEIGNVAASLNFLSENLDNALTSLKKANAKLEEDIEKERKLEKMRRDFVAAVSHELKTPISLIDGYAVGLKDNIFENEDKDYYLDIIIDEAEKMGNLVSDMLDLSYLESGSFKLTREEFNIIPLIKITLKKYENLIKEKNVSLEVNLYSEVKVFADWNRLEQVLTNFITNAIRHVNENGKIYVRTLYEDDFITIEIENTGSHINEEEIDKIWDQFYKIDKSRNRKIGGTGIGLSIVKNILLHHNYPFGVLNTKAGVKFYFKVPKI
ncbi:sensor histidine kinase [Clostridium prolinivorans]|uniref:sensor histidine kinase n=1 Tax=Clostridium prolinivorans TaxID=2769420 RepID=UPI000FDCA5E1|nr:sensor histidine kinase [Clostridium prolinivorans]